MDKVADPLSSEGQGCRRCQFDELRDPSARAGANGLPVKSQTTMLDTDTVSRGKVQNERER